MSKELELARELVRVLEEKEKNCSCGCGSKDSGKVQLSALEPGESFKIGEHDFIVLDQDHESGETKVISRGFMAEDKVFGNTRDYGKSSLKNLIETEIQPVIEREVGSENLVEHYVDLTSVDMQKEFESCKCKVRPITFDEAREYNEFLTNEELDDYWWTCTSWSTEKRGWKYGIAVVSPSGGIRNYDCYSDGVRPVCILKSNIFVSKGDK